MRSPEYNKLVAVLSGADQGYYSLPAAVVDARVALARLQAAAPPVPSVTPGSAARALTTALLAAAGTPKPSWPSADAVVEERRAEEASAAWRAAHQQAEEIAAGAVVALVFDLADELLTEHLRPALTEVLAAVGEQTAAFAPVAEFTDAQLLAAESKYRDAALAIDREIQRLDAVRRAQGVLSGGRCVQDVDGAFSELSNPLEVWGARWGGRHQHAYVPWPTGPRQRLAWLASSNAKPWMPTPAERDQAWAAAFPRRGAFGALTRGGAALVGADGAGS